MPEASPEDPDDGAYLRGNITGTSNRAAKKGLMSDGEPIDSEQALHHAPVGDGAGVPGPGRATGGGRHDVRRGVRYGGGRRVAEDEEALPQVRPAHRSRCSSASRASARPIWP